MMAALAGYKTYLCAAILILGAIAYALGIITSDQLQGLWAIFGPLALAALKDGQNTQTAKIMAKATMNKDMACPPRV